MAQQQPPTVLDQHAKQQLVEFGATSAAAVAAAYYKELVRHGVPPEHAVAITQAWVTAAVSSHGAKK